MCYCFDCQWDLKLSSVSSQTFSLFSLQHLAAERKYEKQLTSQNNALAQAEEQIRILQRHKEDALHDLAAVRDLCARLESNKEKLQRQLTAKTLDEEQVG